MSRKVWAICFAIVCIAVVAAVAVVAIVGFYRSSGTGIETELRAALERWGGVENWEIKQEFHGGKGWNGFKVVGVEVEVPDHPGEYLWIAYPKRSSVDDVDELWLSRVGPWDLAQLLSRDGGFSFRGSIDVGPGSPLPEIAEMKLRGIRDVVERYDEVVAALGRYFASNPEGHATLDGHGDVTSYVLPKRDSDEKHPTPDLADRVLQRHFGSEGDEFILKQVR